jgi:transcriptional regulator with XRE-family HTH domain
MFSSVRRPATVPSVGNSVTAPCQNRRMPTASERPKGLRVQAQRRHAIEQHRRWATNVRWPSPPEQGWLTEVRVASGLSANDVATRMAVSRSAVSYAEASERNGRIQLDVLRRYADAMDADVHYVLVPRASLLQQVDSTGRRRRHLLRLRAHRPKRQALPSGVLRVIAQSEFTSHACDGEP